MKKIFLILITIMSFFVLQKNVNALTYYESFEVYASFDENVKTEEVGNINVMIYVSGGEKNIVLTRNERYRKNFGEIPVGQVDPVLALVQNDPSSLKYDVEIQDVKTKNEGKSGYIEVVVKNINQEETTTSKVELNENQKNIIKGVTSVTTTANTQETTTNNSEIIIEEDTTTTTTISTEKTFKETSEEEKAKKEAEKEKNKKQNNLVLKIMLIIFGIVILVLVLIASVNIARSNK